MKSLFHLFAFDDTYGPGTDLAMALLGIFILSTAISKKNDAIRNNELKIIAENQIVMIDALAANYHTQAKYSTDLGDSGYLISTASGEMNTIAVKNSPVSQLFTFGEGLLFEVGKAELKAKGMKTIGALGKIIKQHAQLIDEIQIQGHADTTPPALLSTYRSNIELASARATTVYQYLKDNGELDPSTILMSIVSYGEFKPVQRNNNRTSWSHKELIEANDTEKERDKNRRIEIVLIYK